MALFSFILASISNIAVMVFLIWLGVPQFVIPATFGLEMVGAGLYSFLLIGMFLPILAPILLAIIVAILVALVPGFKKKAQKYNKYVVILSMSSIISILLASISLSFLGTLGICAGILLSIALLVCPAAVIFAALNIIYCETKQREEKNFSGLSKLRIVAVVLDAIILVFFGFLVVRFTVPYIADGIIGNIQDSHDANEFNELVSAQGNVDKKSDLGPYAKAVCSSYSAGGEYDIVYMRKSDPNNAIIQCKHNREVYSVVTGDKEDYLEEHYGDAFATYFGQTYDPKLVEYFPEEKYFFRDYKDDRPYELNILLEADSEDDLIEKYLDNFYDFIKSLDGEPIAIRIFYDKDLSDIESTLDYFVISAVESYEYDNIFGSLPIGTSSDKRFLPDTDMLAVYDIADDPSLYASSTRNSIKFNPHAVVELKENEKVSKSGLKKILIEAFGYYPLED